MLFIKILFSFRFQPVSLSPSLCLSFSVSEDVPQSYQQSNKWNNVNYILPLQPSSIFLFLKPEPTSPKDPDKKKKMKSNFKGKKAESKTSNDPSKPN
jgi:hypothetical protein